MDCVVTEIKQLGDLVNTGKYIGVEDQGEE